MAKISFDISKVLSNTVSDSYVGDKFPNANDTQDESATYIADDFPNANQAQLEKRETINDKLNHNGTNGAYYMTPTALNGWQLPLEPRIAITAAKKIVSTPLAGNKRRGSVKEIINTQDYNISISGVFMNENSENYPFDDVEKLVDLFETNQEVSITNAITEKLGIENVVITNLSLPEMIGKPNMQAYEISCVSDEDFILIKE